MIEWFPVKGFEGAYLISKCGKIKSLYKSCKILKPKEDKDGYYGVALSYYGKVFHKRVHRLVAETFLDNPNSLPVVNHKDSNNQNNNVDNLEWCTVLGNSMHYIREASDFKGLGLLSDDQLLQIPVIYNEGQSYQEIIDYFGLDCRADAVSELLSGRRFSQITGITEDLRDPSKRHPSKLSEEQVIEIISGVKSGKPQKFYCDKYSMSPAQISRIVNGTRRKSNMPS